jgi:GNAT superfamily N-acetyltransferase
MVGKNEITFTPLFEVDLLWRSTLPLRIGIISPQYKHKIAEGLKYLSLESVRNRFQAPKKEFSEQELNYLTVLDGHNHFAIGIEELDGAKRGVAVVRMVRSSSIHSEAEVAITIIDAYQGHGLGTMLLRLMVLAAFERDIRCFTFTFFPQNEGIVRLIKKVGRTFPGPVSSDSVQLKLDLAQFSVEELKADLARENSLLKEALRNYHSAGVRDEGQTP